MSFFKTQEEHKEENGDERIFFHWKSMPPPINIYIKLPLLCSFSHSFFVGYTVIVYISQGAKWLLDFGECFPVSSVIFINAYILAPRYFNWVAWEWSCICSTVLYLECLALSVLSPPGAGNSHRTTLLSMF